MSHKATVVIDGQTGRSFAMTKEDWFDIVAAWFGIIYSIGVIVYLSWLLLDIWLDIYSAWFLQPYKSLLIEQNSAVFKLIIYTAVGGGIGATVNNIRSFVQWHVERKAFGWRFVWKYISLPPLGMILAVMIYAIIRSGIVAFSGDFNESEANAATAFSAWATGALAGYGSHQVFIWLDDKVNSLFRVTKDTSVPVQSDRIQNSAVEAKQDTGLEADQIADEQTDDEHFAETLSEPEAKNNEIIEAGDKATFGIGTLNKNGSTTQTTIEGGPSSMTQHEIDST